jgi:hypothetical protein
MAFIGEAAREAPAQAELRLTIAGAFRVILAFDAIPNGFLCRLVGQFRRGMAFIGEAARAFPVILSIDATPNEFIGRLVGQFQNSKGGWRS